MKETKFLLKFYPHKRERNEIKSLIAKVKLDKPIHGAKTFEVIRTCFFSLIRTKIFRTNLVNQSHYYINNLNKPKKLSLNQRLIKIKDKNSILPENVLSTDYFLILNNHVDSHYKIKIDYGKINECLLK